MQASSTVVSSAFTPHLSLSIPLTMIEPCASPPLCDCRSVSCLLKDGAWRFSLSVGKELQFCALLPSLRQSGWQARADYSQFKEKVTRKRPVSRKKNSTIHGQRWQAAHSSHKHHNYFAPFLKLQHQSQRRKLHTEFRHHHQTRWQNHQTTHSV